MYSISKREVSVSAPTLAEVKELFAFAAAEQNDDFVPYMTPETFATVADQFLAALPSAVDEANSRAAGIETAATPFNASTQYQDGDLALFGDKVFAKHNGQWIDPSVITPAELAEAEQLKPEEAPSPQAIFGASSSVVAAPSMTAQVATPASEVPPPPGVSSIAPPAVPTPPAAPIADEAHAAGVELDKRGLPWDARIHSSSKAKLKDGNWKLARGIDPALVATVEAELFTAQGAPAAPVVPAITVTEPEFVPPAPPAAPAEPTDFPSLLQRLSSMSASGQINNDQIAAIAMTVGVASLPALASRPDLVPAFWEQVKALK